MTALITRMMKMVAARRLVTEASPGSTSNAFTRAKMPAGEAVDWLSVTATAGIVLGIAAKARGHRPIYQRIVKNRLGGAVVPGHAKHEPQMRKRASGNLAPHPPAVVPAKAGTHNHRA